MPFGTLRIAKPLYTISQKRTLKRIINILLLALTILTSCHPLFCNWNREYDQLTELTSEDIIFGEYRLTEESEEYLLAQGFKKIPRLTLLESGEFNLQDAPDIIFDPFGRSSRQTINKKGTWSTSCGESYDCIFELQGIMVVPLSRKDEGPLAIPITVGDGDECNGIIFERTN